jgi:subtilase family serine protease
VTGIPRSTLALLSSAALIAATAGVAAAAPSNKANKLPGSMPAWANSSHRVGATAGSSAVDFRVYLDWRGGDAATQYAMAAATKGSPEFGKFLTPAQFRAQFSPTKSDVDAVKSWLQGQGFTVDYVPGNRKYVEASGSVDQAAQAFDTSFSQYAVDGKQLRANSTELSVPASLHGVQAVLGLDQSEQLVRTYAAPPPVFNNARPCSAYWGEKTVRNTPTLDKTKLPPSPSAFAPCGYAGAQLQGAYGMSGAIRGGNDGSGVTVAVIDAYGSPTVRQDLTKYSSDHGLPDITESNFREVVAPGTYKRPDNPQHSPSGWSGEETLDVEAVHTMAPGADIVYVGSPNNRQDMDAAMNKVVDDHLADIVTNSYGFAGEAVPPGYRKPFNDILAQAAAEGISVFFSSGDAGDETGGLKANWPSATPDWPAVSPLVTAVGGTSLGVAEDNTRLFELGWETGRSTLTRSGNQPSWTDPVYQYGSGGGTSRIFTQPKYQVGVVPSEISQIHGGAPMRAVPDVSALADPTTGMLVGQTQTFPDGHTEYSEYRIGGTSLASPLYAGMFALAVQRHGAYGLANPALYAANGTTFDITKNGLDTYPGAVRADYVNGVDAADGYSYTARWFDFDAPLTIHVQNGYDDVTGVGSPQGDAWLNAVVGYHR